MLDNILSSLFSTLSVQVHAFAYCEIQTGWTLDKNGIADAILVHYVLAGSGRISVEGQKPQRFGPNCMVIPPRGMRHSIGFAGAAQSVTAEDARRFLPNRLISLTAGDGSRDLLLACGSISARYAGAIGLFDRLHDALIEDLSESDRLRDAFAFMVEEIARPRARTDRSESFGISKRTAV